MKSSESRKTMIVRVAPKIHTAVKFLATFTKVSMNDVVEAALENYKPVKEVVNTVIEGKSK